MWEDTKDGRLLVELISAACNEGSLMEQGDRAARGQSEEISPQALSNISYWRELWKENWGLQGPCSRIEM